jgi:DNA polymerase-3 subunit alpha (Gram-positive type)
MDQPASFYLPEPHITRHSFAQSQHAQYTLSMQPLTTTFDHAIPDLVIFDLETSGFFPGEHEILEIGAVRMSPDVKTTRGEFNRRIRPERPEAIAPEIMEIEGLTRDMLMSGDPPATVLHDFAKFTHGSVLGGYNVAFDWGFLKQACRHYNVTLTVDYHIFDVMSLVLADVLRHGQARSIRLKDELLRLGLPEQPVPHRAIVDARLTVQVLQKLVVSHAQ